MGLHTPWTFHACMRAGDVGYVGCWLDIPFSNLNIFEKGYISFSFLGAEKPQTSQQIITTFRISILFMLQVFRYLICVRVLMIALDFHVIRYNPDVHTYKRMCIYMIYGFILYPRVYTVFI